MKSVKSVVNSLFGCIPQFPGNSTSTQDAVSRVNSTKFDQIQKLNQKTFSPKSMKEKLPEFPPKPDRLLMAAG